MKQLTYDFLIELFDNCINNRDFFNTINKHIIPNYFIDDDMRELWNELTKRYKIKGDSQEGLSIGLMTQEISNKNKKGRYDDVLSILDDIKVSHRTGKTDAREVLKTFEVFIKQNKFVQLFEDTGQLYNNSKREEAYELFTQGAESFSNFSMSGAEFTKVFEGGAERMRQRLAKEVDAIPLLSGFTPLDNRVGGFYTGETELWVGESGAAKTKLLCQRGITTARLGYDVLHVQAEGTEDQCLNNIDACWSGIKYQDLKTGAVDVDKISDFEKLGESIDGEIFVKAFEKFGTPTLMDVRNMMIDLIKMGRNVKHIVLDYLDLFDLGDGTKFAKDDAGERLKQIALARMFKNIAMEFNVLGTTVAQTHTIPTQFWCGGKRKDEDYFDKRNFLTRYNIGQSTRKIEPYTYVFTINQTATDRRKKRRVWIYEDKLRESASGRVYVWLQDLGRSRFFVRKKTVSKMSVKPEISIR